MLFSENLVVFNVFYVNLKAGIFQDCGNPYNRLAKYPEMVKLIVFSISTIGNFQFNEDYQCKTVMGTITTIAQANNYSVCQIC